MNIAFTAFIITFMVALFIVRRKHRLKWIALETPISQAVVNNDIATLRALLDSGVDPDSIVLVSKFGKGTNTSVDGSPVNSLTALMFAAKHSNECIVESLIEYGANVNYSNRAGSTALNYAIFGISLEIATLLLSNNAETNPTGENSEAPLLLAANAGKINEVKLLLSFGADINARGPSNETGLMLAIEGNHIQLANELITSGADVNIVDDKGHTALWEARRVKNSLLIKLLKDSVASN